MASLLSPCCSVAQCALYVRVNPSEKNSKCRAMMYRGTIYIFFLCRRERAKHFFAVASSHCPWPTPPNNLSCRLCSWLLRKLTFSSSWFRSQADAPSASHESRVDDASHLPQVRAKCGRIYATISLSVLRQEFLFLTLFFVLSQNLGRIGTWYLNLSPRGLYFSSAIMGDAQTVSGCIDTG